METGGRASVEAAPTVQVRPGMASGMETDAACRITCEGLRTSLLFGARKKSKKKLRFPAMANWRTAMH